MGSEVYPVIHLLETQKRWLADDSRFKIIHSTRQAGKTSVMASLEPVHSAFALYAEEGKSEDWVILSRGERQSREIMRYVKRHCQVFGKIAGEIEMKESFFTGDDGVKYTQLEIELPWGSRFIGLPANPDTARGYSANVVLDEFGRHMDSREIWAALFPIISAGYKIRVLSTGNGKRNKFYEIMSSTDELWVRYRLDIYKAIREGLPRDAEELKLGLGDDDMWAQEYECAWLDEASAWLSFDLINGVEHELAGEPSEYQGGPCYVGNDIAIRKDLWVVWVWEQVGDVLWTREVIVRQRINFAEQDRLLDHVMMRYRVVRLCMDQTSMGEKPVEDAKRRYGDGRVEGIIFSKSSKVMLATIGKQRIQERLCRIPMGDQPIRADFHSLKREETASGDSRFVVEKEETDGHADRAWAAFMGAYAAGGEREFFGYESVNSTNAQTFSRFSKKMRGWFK